VCLSRDLCPDPVLFNSEFFNDWSRPQNIGHGVSATVLKTQRLVGLFGLLQDIGDPSPSEEKLALLRALMPHLGRAVKLLARIVELETRDQVQSDALNHWFQGVFLLDRSGRVTWMNRMAEGLVKKADGLSVQHDRLCAALPHETLQLENLVRQTLAAKVSGPNIHGVLTVSRLAKKRPLVLSVDRLSTHRTLFADVKGVCIVVVSDPDASVSSGEGVLRHLYGLTGTESRVALLLAQGSDVKEIAEHLSVLPNTVRIHLKNIFHKTSTKRQAELLRVLLRGPLSLLGE
jgi:DNA-binding CsgD family transcriptional regulator